MKSVSINEVTVPGTIQYIFHSTSTIFSRLRTRIRVDQTYTQHVYVNAVKEGRFVRMRRKDGRLSRKTLVIITAHVARKRILRFIYGAIISVH